MSGSGEGEHSLTAGIGASLLSFASGATDVLSYMTLGHVFTSAMTGAAALFLLSLVNAHYPRAIRAAVALAGYLVGTVLATALQPRDQDRVKEARTLRRLLILEALVLGAYCIVSALGQHPSQGVPRYGLIVLSAVAMGIQALIARDISEPGVSTVVLNTTLSSIAVAATRLALGRGLARLPRRNKVQMAVVLAYAVGAAGSAASHVFSAFPADFLPLIAVLGVLGLYQYNLVQG